jgi:lysophospholipase L1-like esterase
MKFRFLLACVLFTVACTAGLDEPRWIGSWGASPLPPRGALGPFPATPAFNNQTIRQTIRLTAGGDRVRVRLTNEYGSEPLTIGTATISRTHSDGTVRLDTMRSLTFGGRKSATIPAGAPLTSDPVDLAVDDLESLSIALYLPDDTGPCTCHAIGMQTAHVSEQGDFTETDFTAVDTISARAFLSGVDVYSSEPAQAVVLLGDSLTDGLGSTADANRRWPDRLAERLSARNDEIAWGVVNAGISGNRILHDGAGESAIARFDRDVLSVSAVSHVVVFEGINDLGFAFGPPGGPLAEVIATLPAGEITAESMITGYRQLIGKAHSNGLRIYAATITPYEGSGYYSREGEAIRQTINEWIRESGEFDAVLDFDAVVRDPSQPAAIADGLHIGDFLHMSDAGYRRIGDSIDLALFD